MRSFAECPEETLKKPRQLALGILGMVLLTQGCSNGLASTSPLLEPTSTPSRNSEPDESPHLTAPASLDGGPEDAAAALADPARVEEGLWLLLRGLGIGVYTRDGEQVLAGSETRPEDFWIYDFEFPLMARMAMAPPVPFSEFQPKLEALGLGPSREEVLNLYRQVYDANADNYLVRLFAATNLRFEGDPYISPLQEWLLLLDTFLPPNASFSTGRSAGSWITIAMAASSPAALVRPGTSTRGAQTQPCGWIKGGGFQANWGLVNTQTGAADLMAAETAYYAIHGPLLARSVGAELRADKDHAHEGHGAPGDTITFDVAMDVDYRLGALIPIGLPSCGYLLNLDPPLPSGELPPAHIWWRTGRQFADHGSFTDVRGHNFDGSQPTETDPSGNTSITFQARQEPANGQGEERSSGETVLVSFEPREWFAAMGLSDHRLLSFLPSTMIIAPSVSVDLEWHEPVAYELRFDSTFVTNTFTPSGTSGPINVTQHVRAVVTLEWSDEDQTYTGEAPLVYVLFEVPPIIGLGGDGGFFEPCPNETSATGGTFRVLRLTGPRGAAESSTPQTPVPGLELIFDPGTTTESIVPVCPPPASVPPGFSFPLPTWTEQFGYAHYQEAQAEGGPYIIRDWVAGAGGAAAVKTYTTTNSAGGIMTTTETTTLTLVED